MSILERAGIDQCVKFYLIKNDEVPKIGPDTDFFVAPQKHVTLTIPNGTTLTTRDVVVLGSLTIQSSDMTNTAIKGVFTARDVFISGLCAVRNIQYTARNQYITRGGQAFRKEIQDLFIEWLDIQAEYSQKSGLKSVLDRSFLY